MNDSRVIHCVFYETRILFRGTKTPEKAVTDQALIRSRDLNVEISATAVCVVAMLLGSYYLTLIATGAIEDIAQRVLFTLIYILPVITLFALLERKMPAMTHKSAKEWALTTRITLVLLIGQQSAGVLAVYIAGVLSRYFDVGWMDFRFADGTGIIGLIAAALLSLFIGDFFYYWFHRLEHKTKFLWQGHKLHHMDENLNVLSEFRAHWIEPTVALAFTTIPLVFLFKFDPLIGLAGTINFLLTLTWGMFFHSNLRIQLGWASPLLSGPQLHRIHHSVLPEHHDRNFAAVFPIWDVIFGTYHHPARDEFPPTGLTSERQVRTCAEAVLLPFREWWRMLSRYWSRPQGYAGNT